MTTDYSLNNEDCLYKNGTYILEKFSKLQLETSNELQNANILWNVNANVYPHIGYLPFLVTMNLMNKSNKRVILVSDMHSYDSEFKNESIEYNSKMQTYYDIFSSFNVGTIIKYEDIYYTKNYQQNFFHVAHSIKITEAIECMNKKMSMAIEINTEPTSSLIFILFIITNILYFDISHVLIEEHEMSLYTLIKSLLLDKYDKILNIIEMPILPNLNDNAVNSQSVELTQILLDASRSQMDDQFLYLKPQQKTIVFNYFNTLKNLLLNEQISYQAGIDLVDIIENIKETVLLSSILNKKNPVYVAASFLTDQFHVLKQHWKKHTNKNDASTGTGKNLDGIEGNHKGFEPSLGGKFIIINWFSKEIVYMLDLDSPAGFFIHDNYLYIANNRLNYISVIDLNTRIEIRRINNRAFNCLHSIHYVENQTILATSTGIDAILQVDLQGEILNDWYATEHEYKLTPKGKERDVSRDFDHREYTYPTLHQTTHINSAVILNEEYCLATLFHQGTLVQINRRNGQSKILLSELKCPHGIKRYKPILEYDIEWMLCNTRRSEILLLNKTFKIIRRMCFEDVNWLQDASQIQNGHIIIADANNSRIIEIDPIINTVVTEFNYSTNWRIYQINDRTDFQTSFIPC